MRTNKKPAPKHCTKKLAKRKDENFFYLLFYTEKKGSERGKKGKVATMAELP
jgi:hypothetical protein